MHIQLSAQTWRVLFISVRLCCMLLLGALLLLLRDTSYAQAQQAALLTRLVLLVELIAMIAVGYIERP